MRLPKLSRTAVMVAVAGSALGIGSCATKSQTGAAVGAAGGAVVGGVIGKAVGSTTAGVLVGAAVGGAAGAIIGAEMDKQAKELEQNIKGARVERVGEGIAVIFESGLLFDFNSDAIKPTAAANLKELAGSLEKYPNSEVLIVGHTDSIGSHEYNQSLSLRRARSAASFLQAEGVPASRLDTRGRGEIEPVADNGTDSGRGMNRRVEVAIYASKEYRDSVMKSVEK